MEVLPATKMIKFPILKSQSFSCQRRLLLRIRDWIEIPELGCSKSLNGGLIKFVAST